jgi:hypothetical protein
VRKSPRHPKIKRVVQEKVGQDWTDHSPNAKGNFGRLSSFCRLRAALFRSEAFSGAKESSAGS